MPSGPRVAIVAASLDIVGGQGVQASSLVEALERDGQPVSLLAINPRFPYGLRWVRRLPGIRTIVNQLMYVPSLFSLGTVDVVHVFSASYWSFLISPMPAMIAGRLLNKRVVLHYHSGEADDHLSNWGVLVHPWLRLAHEIVVPSEYLKGVFARHGYRADVVPNVVDLSRFRYRERRPLCPRFLSARNLEPHYRVENVIEAFARLRREEPAATLTVAGSGSQHTRLRQLAASLAGDAIRFVGKVDPEAMPALYAEHDIFVNASVVDNQPVSILEAFSAGLPVVSTATGDIPFMIKDRETGLLVRPGDVAALTAALVAVWRDPEGARQRAEQARNEVTKYTWPAVREPWAEIYSERTRRDEIAVSAESR